MTWALATYQKHLVTLTVAIFLVHNDLYPTNMGSCSTIDIADGVYLILSRPHHNGLFRLSEISCYLFVGTSSDNYSVLIIVLTSNNAAQVFPFIVLSPLTAFLRNSSAILHVLVFMKRVFIHIMFSPHVMLWKIDHRSPDKNSTKWLVSNFKSLVLSGIMKRWDFLNFKFIIYPTLPHSNSVRLW